MEKFKKILNSIWTIINSKVFLLLVVGVFIFFLFKSCGNSKELRRQAEISNQNISALTDSIKIVKNKNGDLSASIDGYISNQKDLLNLNNSLSIAVNKEKGKVLSLNKTILTLKQDKEMLEKYSDSLKNIIGTPIDVGGGNFNIPWTLNYTYDSINSDKFEGITKIKLTPTNIFHLNTKMISRVSTIGLTFGQKIEDDKLRIFVNSNYPGLTPTSLEGVLIDPNTNPYMKKLMKKKMFLPNVWSVGAGGTIGYDFLHNQPALVFGINVSYSLYQW